MTTPGGAEDPVPPPNSATLAPRRLRWALLGASLAYAAPELPGRETVIHLLRRYALRFDARVEGVFGGSLRFEGNPLVDSATFQTMCLRFAEPVLAPVLEAALRPGGFFVDVGANVGVYTLWAARCVGEEGRVEAFEPVPEPRAWLERNVALNGFTQVSILPKGLGESPGRITLYRPLRASGLSSRYLAERDGPVEVEVTTLDDHFADGRATPDLLKIDVEGMELEVLKGGRALLAAAEPPLLVLEAQPKHLEAAGTSYAELCAFLREAGGYATWSLGPDGIEREPDDAVVPASDDVVAARPDSERHARVLETLSRARFRDQRASSHTRLLAPVLGAVRNLLRSRA